MTIEQNILYFSSLSKFNSINKSGKLDRFSDLSICIGGKTSLIDVEFSPEKCITYGRTVNIAHGIENIGIVGISQVDIPPIITHKLPIFGQTEVYEDKDSIDTILEFPFILPIEVFFNDKYYKMINKIYLNRLNDNDFIVTGYT